MNRFSKILILCMVFFAFALNSCSGEGNTETPLEETNLSSSERKSVEGNWVEVGVLKNGIPVLNGNKEALLKSWNTYLKKMSGIEGNFKDVYIDGTKGDYQLVFKGDQIQSSFYVRLSSSSTLIAAGDTSCTTSDCSHENRGCVVKYDQGEPGYCSPCANGGKCTKTTSNIAMISNSLQKD